MKLRFLVLSVLLLCSGAVLAFDQEETFTDLNEKSEFHAHALSGSSRFCESVVDPRL